MSARAWPGRLAAAARAAFGLLREWSGDAAYERYLARAGAAPLSPTDFWLEHLRRRYDRIGRCC